MPETTRIAAHFLTKAAEITGDRITTDVVESGDSVRVECRGCDRAFPSWPLVVAERLLDDAQLHASTCTAIPRTP
jgi:hypothetical protein